MQTASWQLYTPPTKNKVNDTQFTVPMTGPTSRIQQQLYRTTENTTTSQNENVSQQSQHVQFISPQNDINYSQSYNLSQNDVKILQNTQNTLNTQNLVNTQNSVNNQIIKQQQQYNVISPQNEIKIQQQGQVIVQSPQVVQQHVHLLPSQPIQRIQHVHLLPPQNELKFINPSPPKVVQLITSQNDLKLQSQQQQQQQLQQLQQTQQQIQQQIQQQTSQIQTQNVQNVSKVQNTSTVQNLQTVQNTQLGQIGNQSQQSVMHEVHVHEQPLTVVPRDQLEEQFLVKYRKLEEYNEQLLQENMRLKSVQASEKMTVIEDTTKITFYQKEIARIKNEMYEMELEIENWRKKYIQLEAQTNFQYGLEIDHLNLKSTLQETEIILRAEIKSLEADVEYQKQRYRNIERKMADLREENERNLQSKESQIRDLQNKIALFTTEMERLNLLVSDKTALAEKWRNRFNELEQGSLDKDREINTLKAEMNKLQEMIDQRNSEIKIMKAKQINPQEYENKILMLQQEIARLSGNLKSKSDENDRYKSEIAKLNAELKDPYRFREFQDKIFKLEGTVRRYETELAERDRMNEQLRNELESLREQLLLCQSSSEKVTTLSTEVNTWKKRFTDLNREYHQCQENLMLAEAELDSLKKKGIEVREITRVEQRIHTSQQQPLISSSIKQTSSIQRTSTSKQQ